MVTDLGCLAWDTWKGFFTVRECLCPKSVRAGPKATPPVNFGLAITLIKIWLSFRSLWKAKNSRLRIWGSMSFGLYLNSLHLSFNLGILGTCLSRGILICHVLECSSTKAGRWMTKLEYAHINKWEIQEGFSALQSKLYHTAAILSHFCPHMAPRGTMAGCDRDLWRQSWVELRTWAEKGNFKVYNMQSELDSGFGEQIYLSLSSTPSCPTPQHIWAQPDLSLSFYNVLYLLMGFVLHGNLSPELVLLPLSPACQAAVYCYSKLWNMVQTYSTSAGLRCLVLARGPVRCLW